MNPSTINIGVFREFFTNITETTFNINSVKQMQTELESTDWSEHFDYFKAIFNSHTEEVETSSSLEIKIDHGKMSWH